MISIPTSKNLEPYFKIAEDEAHKSPCIRRQYGAVIVPINSIPDEPRETDFKWFTASHNKRISRCCNDGCVRDRINTRHGGSVEIGGEIHAETSALIKNGLGGLSHFILVGFEHEKQLTGINVYPCHACAMALSFAGFKYIYIRDKKMEIIPVSISNIIEYRIGEWEPE